MSAIQTTNSAFSPHDGDVCACLRAVLCAQAPPLRGAWCVEDEDVALLLLTEDRDASVQ